MKSIKIIIGLCLLYSCRPARQAIPTAEAMRAKKAIYCTYMRGGTSKGPFFDMRDLPADPVQRNQILLKIMGSPDRRQIDGLGGSTTVTSKVVLAQPSKRKGIDIDYLFAQVDIDNPVVDTTPPCGNMMAGVGPFAIEKGWVKAVHPETKVMIYNINTQSVIEAVVQTPNGVVRYDGDMSIDGVPGTASPVILNLFDQVGGKTGKLLPTGNIVDTIQGIRVSLLDAGSTMMLVKASDLGLQGTEDAAFFDKNKTLMQQIENLRLEAGLKMGLGDVRQSVLPKVGILSAPRRNNSNITSRYLTPHALHPAHAVTGAICIATALKIRGSVASEVGNSNGKSQEMVIIEHPSGIIEISIDIEAREGKIHVKKAGTIRTVRKIMEGVVFF